MTTDEIEATRPRFEKWIRDEGWSNLSKWKTTGRYKSAPVCVRWDSWSEALRGVPSPAEVVGGKGEGEE